MSEERKATHRRFGCPKGSFTFWMKADLRARLEADAASAGRTLSEEVHLRLERSFEPHAAVGAEIAYAPNITINVNGMDPDDIARSVEQALEASRRFMNS